MDDSTTLWRGQRVLVTGSTGFLGSAVVEELLGRGAEVVGLVRNRTSAAAFARHQLAGRIHFVYGRTDDLFRIHSALAVYETRAVFHLAAAEPGSSDRGTTTVLDGVRRFDPRLPVVVARPTGTAPVIDSPVPLGVARFGELFGSGDRNTKRLVPATALSLLSGERTALGAERGARDYVHVRDAARACLMLAEALANGQMPQVREATFRSDWVFTDREMTEAIHRACAGHSAPFARRTPLANPFGWSPTLNFSEAMADTVGWYREFSRSRAISVRSSEKHRAAA